MGLAFRAGVVAMGLVSGWVGSAYAAAVWAVGENGTIICTDGPGQPWTSRTSGTTNLLRSVSFPDADHGWVTGNSGTILHTVDGGSTWTSQSIGDTQNFQSIQFLDPLHGWVVAGTNSGYQTVDGGETWTPMNLPVVSGGGTAVGVHFFNLSHGWLGCFGFPLWETVNGGQTWSAKSSSQLFLSLEALDSNHIWAGTNTGKLMFTVDGGNTWQTSIPGSGALWNVSFADSQSGWTEGSPWWNIARTADGGANWSDATASTTAAITCLKLLDASHGWVFGGDGRIVYSEDGGVSFNTQVSPTTYAIRGATVAVPEPAILGLLLPSVALIRRRVRR